MKAPDQPHFIQRFKFDFEIDRKEDAHALQNDLSRIFNQSIKGMLDDIMSELDDPTQVIRIPSLEIDLGEIYEGSLEREILMRFEKEFRQVLAMRVGELRHKGAVVSRSKGEVVQLMPARSEIVAFFLVNGRLPVGAEQMAGKVEALFLELIDNDEDLVRRMLRTVAMKENAMIRLATSFSERLVARLYKVILPDTGVSLPGIEQQLIAEARRVSKRPLSQITKEVRRAMFAHLLLPTGRSFDRVALMKHVKASLGRVFQEIQPEWVEETGATAPQENLSEQKDRLARTAAAIEVLTRFLRGSTPLPDTLNVIEAWEHLVADDPVALRKYLGSSKVTFADIGLLVRTVSTASIKDLVAQLVPNAPMQMLRVAAAVTTAFATYGRGASAEQRLALDVYVTLIQQLAKGGSSVPTVAKVADAIKAQLKKNTEVPKEFLKNWAELGLPGSPTAAQRRAEKARKEAESAAAEREFQEKIAELRSRSKSTEPEDEAGSPEGKTAEEKAKAAAKSKKVGAEAEEIPDMDDETFFREARERLLRQEQEGVEVLSVLDDAAIGNEIDTPAGRAELVLQAILAGGRPWWAPNITSVQLEAFLRSSLTEDSAAVKVTVHRMVRNLAAAERKRLISRLLETLNESTLNMLATALAPDISGFLVTVGMALKALRQYAEGAGLSIPSEFGTELRFVQQPILEYLLEYLSGSLTVGHAVRFILRQLAQALGMSPRAMIEQMGVIAEEALAKGEKRFNVFKSVLPKTFEGLQVPPPTPHEPTDNPWAALEPWKAELEARLTEEPTKAQPALEVPELMGMDQRILLQRLLAAQSEERRARQLDEAERLAEEKAEQGPDAGRNEGKEEKEEKEGREGKEGKEQEGGEAGRLEPGKEQPQTPREGIQETGTEEGEKPVAEEEQPAKLRERLSREQTLERIARERPRFAGAEVDEPEVVIATIRQYLEHGTLSAEATAFFTETTFRAMVVGTLRLPTKAMAAMLRQLMVKAAPRARVIAMGEETALLLIGVLQPMIAEKMRPFTVELLRIAGMGGGPIGRVQVLDHAIRHALRAHGSAFSPLGYVQEFVDYAGTLPGRKVKDVVIWAMKRLEGRSTPLAEAMLEVLDVLERAETQAVKRKKPQAPAARPEQVMIKAPDGDIYVSNCGATLIFAVFQTLFHSFKLLTEDKRSFVSMEAATRAAHYIQYMTDHELDPPEEKMVLNKLMVGLPIDKPLEPLSEPLTEDERDTCDYLINYVMDKWTVMKNASPDYVRKTFLQREGRLHDNVTNWILRVQQNGLDLLKNKIPWGTNPVRLPWLSYSIEVDWP